MVQTMEQILSKTKFSDPSSDKKPLIISGPCSAETEEQVLATALALQKTG